MKNKSSIDYTIAVNGMYCAGCAGRIENVLKRTEGINSVKVNFATSSAFLEFNPALVDFHTIQKKIENLGYSIQIKENIFTKERIKKIKQERKKNLFDLFLFLIGFFSSLPLMIHMIFDIHINEYIQLFLATIVQFFVGFRFHRNALKTIVTGGANMDVLVSLGTNFAYFYSVFVMLWGKTFNLNQHLYFESSAVVITFVILGKILEGITKRKANQAIEDLFSLQPLIIHRIRNQSIEDVDFTEISENDLVLVRPGENIPCDGLIEEGISEINESLITGESLPVRKSKGDEVFSGTTNLSGMLKIRVLKKPEDSTLSRVLKMVEDTQNSKAEVQRLADIVSGYFAYGVILISIISFIVSYFILDISFSESLIRMVSVLVIACPCALGLATPIAILIGSSIAAKYGILFRNATSLEYASKIQKLIFDKTGTITTGKLKVVDFNLNYINSRMSETIIRSMIFSVESSLDHPIAKSIANFMEPNSRLLEIKEVENIPGYGVRAIVKLDTDNFEVYIGSQEFVEKVFDSKIPLKYNDSIYTTVFFYINNIAYGVFYLSDELRKEAKETIAKLKELNIEIYLVSGDKRKVVENMVRILDIKNFYAESKPEDKLKIIEAIQKQGFVVGMVGDGVNDAPALSRANVSFALGEGVTISKETSDVNLLHNNLLDIPFSIFLSRKILRKIKQNLFFAFIYNILGIPMAVMGYLNPVVAGFAMAMSSVSVVSSSLFLYLIKKE